MSLKQVISKLTQYYSGISEFARTELKYAALNLDNVIHEGLRRGIYPQMWDERRNLGFRTYHKNPVVLIPGWGQNRGVYLDTVGRLKEHGFELAYRVNTNQFTSVEDNIMYLDKKISKIIKQSRCRSKRVDLIGHSFGGLIARAYSYKHPDKVGYCIMLGTPNNGTWLALPGYIGTTLVKYSLLRFLGLSLDNTSSYQMIPGSVFLTKLNKKEPPKSVKFYNIYTKSDEFVLRNRSEILPFAENIPVERFGVRNRGHLALIHDPKIVDGICGILKRKNESLESKVIQFSEFYEN